MHQGSSWSFLPIWIAEHTADRASPPSHHRFKICRSTFLVDSHVGRNKRREREGDVLGDGRQSLFALHHDTHLDLVPSSFFFIIILPVRRFFRLSVALSRSRPAGSGRPVFASGGNGAGERACDCSIPHLTSWCSP